MTPDCYFSIIIPHRNIPRLLERCLASIPRREDTEIIVVDDNSDPSQVDFDSFPGLGQSGVKVIFSKKEGGGAGYARNAGLDAARGRWLIFADADDEFLPAAGEMMDRYRDSDLDEVVFGSAVVDGDTGLPLAGKHLRDRMIAQYLRSGDEGVLRYCMWAPWAKFVKRSAVEEGGIRFSEIPFSNDIFFSVRCGHAAKTIAFDPTPVYLYAPRLSSLTGTTNHRWEPMEIRFREDVRVAEFLDAEGKGAYFSKHLVKRWKHMMRMNREKAIAFLPVVRRHAPAGYVMSVRLKLALDPVLQPLKKLVKRK